MAEVIINKKNVKQYRGKAGLVTIRRFGKVEKQFTTDDVYPLFHTICSLNKKETGNSYARDKLKQGWCCYFAQNEDK